MRNYFWCLILLTFIGFDTTLHSKTSPDFDWHQQNDQVRLGSLKVTEVQEAFRKGMQEFLKGGDSIKIRFFASSRDEIFNGHFRQVEVIFKDNMLQGMENLNIRRGRAVFRGVKFDLSQLILEKKLVVKSIKSVKFNFRLKEDDINSYLVAEQKRINLRNPKIELKNGAMIFSAKVRNRFFSARVRTEGNFEVRPDGRSVDFKANRVRLNSLKIPGFVTGQIVNRINPILKLDKFPLMGLIPVKLNKIEIGQDWVEFYGS